ncbi:hypothetical protein N9U05_00045 [bacterium]|jgi:hypothetical protein|nr:hypothetical protein [bacterium]
MQQQIHKRAPYSQASANQQEQRQQMQELQEMQDEQQAQEPYTSREAH